METQVDLTRLDDLLSLAEISEISDEVPTDDAEGPTLRSNAVREGLALYSSARKTVESLVQK